MSVRGGSVPPRDFRGEPRPSATNDRSSPSFATSTSESTSGNYGRRAFVRSIGAELQSLRPVEPSALVEVVDDGRDEHGGHHDGGRRQRRQEREGVDAARHQRHECDTARREEKVPPVPRPARVRRHHDVRGADSRSRPPAGGSDALAAAGLASPLGRRTAPTTPRPPRAVPFVCSVISFRCRPVRSSSADAARRRQTVVRYTVFSPHFSRFPLLGGNATLRPRQNCGRSRVARRNG